MQLGLYQRQTVELVMTTELRQAIGLLQYNTTDLLSFLQEQAVENPLIELEEPEINYKFEAEFDSQSGRSHSRSQNWDEYVNPIDYVTQSENQLLDFIMEQINCLKIDERKRDILEYIVLNLDNNGYLSLSTSELGDQLATNEDEIETCLEVLGRLEPIGLGARSVKECLLMQAYVRFPSDETMHLLIEHYLGELADKKWDVIAEDLSISLDDINHIANAILSLNPKPCAGLFNGENDYVYPDVVIDEDFDDYAVVLGDRYLPRPKLNADYVALKSGDSRTASFIKSHYQNYVWMMNSIEQRRVTIMKIVKTIIKKQPEFLKYGFTHLKPMTMKEIADEIDMHESTVSRATRNKIIRTPVGLFEMSKMFSAKLRRSGSMEYASSAQVKLLLKQLIEQENPRRPLSDQKLADIMKVKKGVTISRRTVAKYRDELNILSSTKRKQVV